MPHPIHIDGWLEFDLDETGWTADDRYTNGPDPGGLRPPTRIQNEPEAEGQTIRERFGWACRNGYRFFRADPTAKAVPKSLRPRRLKLHPIHSEPVPLP